MAGGVVAITQEIGVCIPWKTTINLFAADKGKFFFTVSSQDFYWGFQQPWRGFQWS